MKSKTEPSAELLRRAALGDLFPSLLHSLSGSMSILSLGLGRLQRTIDAKSPNSDVFSDIQNLQKQLSVLVETLQAFKSVARADKRDFGSHSPAQLLELAARICADRFKNNAVTIAQSSNQAIAELGQRNLNYLFVIIQLLNLGIDDCRNSPTRSIKVDHLTNGNQFTTVLTWTKATGASALPEPNLQLIEALLEEIAGTLTVQESPELRTVSVGLPSAEPKVQLIRQKA